MPENNFTKDDITAFVSVHLPKFAEACKTKKGDAILMHQDAFAADLQSNELTLLGMAIKFAGFHGRPITIIGTHNETLKQ